LINEDSVKIIEFCRKYLDMNPTDNILREKLAEAYKKQKDYELAEKKFSILLDQGEHYGTIYFNLGICNYHIEKYEDSLLNLKKAKDLCVDVPDEFFTKLEQKITK
jgi:tetratricopeptide (TPR) repeat protein